MSKNIFFVFSESFPIYMKTCTFLNFSPQDELQKYKILIKRLNKFTQTKKKNQKSKIKKVKKSFKKTNPN